MKKQKKEKVKYFLTELVFELCARALIATVVLACVFAWSSSRWQIYVLDIVMFIWIIKPIVNLWRRQEQHE